MSNKLTPESSIQGARQFGPKRKLGAVHGDVVKGESFELDGVTYPINGKGRGCQRDWLIRLINHARGMMDIYGRVLVVRIDLHQSDYREKNETVTAFIEAMTKQIARKYGHAMGYLWAREQETAKAQHYHVALILDGDKVARSNEITALAGKVWGKMSGTVGYCADPYMMIGRGAVLLEDATHWLSYLTKIRGKGYRADYAQDFSTGRVTIKARAKRKAKITKVVPTGWLPWRNRGIGRVMTVGEFRAMGLDIVAAQSWGKVGGLKVVAKRLGVDQNTVRGYVKRHRPDELENANRLREKRQEADRAKGLEMLAQGKTRQEVAEALGVCEVTPWNWIEKDSELAAKARAKRDDQAERKRKAFEMMRAGSGAGEVIAALGIGRSTAVRWRRECGAPMRASCGVKGTPERKAAAVAMRAGGATIQEVGDALGVDPSTAAKWYRNHMAKLTSQDDTGKLSET